MPIPTLVPRVRSGAAPWRRPISEPDQRRRRLATKQKPRRWLRLALMIAGGCILFGALAVIGAFAWFSRDLPDPNGIIDRSVAQSTKIFARDGATLLYEVHGEERRTIIELADVPEHLRWATIDIEDKDFYKHGGVDLRGIFRAIVTNVIRLDTHGQGGSTITQQFVKNAILTSEKSYVRKIKEAVLAYQIERRFTKDQILKLYFNEIPYGRNAYGIEAAAQGYFGKRAQEISLDEAAFLAALPQAPTYYSPDGNHTDALLGRQDHVLDTMRTQGHITEEEAEAAKQVDTLAKVITRRESIRAPHFVIYVKEQLTEKYGEKLVEQGGLRVITTLDPTLQNYAETAVIDGMAKVERYGGSNAALVSLNPKTGQVLAMVGSRDYFDADHDGNVNVVLRPRQPGSSFKPVVYTQAFREGYTPETLLFDLTTNFGGSPAYIPKNYDGQEHGLVSMRQALAGSLNIPAVKTLYLAGINDVLDLAHRLGYTTLNDPDRYGLSLTLGGGEVRLIEHAAAFGVLANDGVRQNTVTILRVEDRNGKVLESAEEGEGERIIDSNIARLTNNILSDNGARAFIFGERNFLTLGGRPVAAKTGTTNDFRDAWTIGYTPDFVAGVWAGNNDNHEMGRGADGSVIAAPIWHNFMQLAISDTPFVRFPSPKPNDADKPILQGRLASGTMIYVDKSTGKEIPASCLDKYPRGFVEQRELEEAHTILFFVDKDNPRGPQPAHPERDPQFERWEAPVRAWAEANGKLARRPAQEDCSLRDEKNNPVVTIARPKNGAIIDNSKLEARATVSGKRDIAAVVFSLDDVKVVELAEPPFIASIPLKSVGGGLHKISVLATDSIGQQGSASVEFNYQPGGASATLYFTAPDQGAELPVSQAAIISAKASDPAGISKIVFLLNPLGETKALRLDAASAAGNVYQASWSPTQSGDYQIRAELTNKNDAVLTSDALLIHVVAD